MRRKAAAGRLILEPHGNCRYRHGGGGSDLEEGDDPGMLKVSQCGQQVTACRREALEVCNDCTPLAFPGARRSCRERRCLRRTFPPR